jgi:hypothetical protein
MTRSLVKSSMEDFKLSKIHALQVRKIKYQGIIQKAQLKIEQIDEEIEVIKSKDD